MWEETMWEELQRAIRRREHDSLRTSTNADLDAFEADRGFKLPKSYREFAKTIGSCSFTGDGLSGYSIAAPGVGDYTWHDLDQFNIIMKELLADDFEPEDPEIGPRLIFFASDNDAQYGWDPEEVTDNESHEYAIWVRYDGYWREDASTFEEFVKVTCLRETLEAWRQWVVEGGEAIIGTADYDQEKDRRILLRPR